MRVVELRSEPAPGLGYHQLLRAGRASWPWLLLGLAVVVGLLVFIGGQVVAGIVAGIGFALGAEVDIEPVTPWGLAALNASWAAAIPLTAVGVLLVHGVAPRWLASVVGRFRWRWFVTCLGLSLVALVATIVVTMLLPQPPGLEVGGSVNEFSARSRDFLLVIVLMTPLQAAGEEVAFRGYLTQAFGGALSGRVGVVVAVVVPALLFALAHGAQSLPVFADRFAFGLVAGTLTVATGGLEAGIAMHVLNNLTAFGLALTFGDLDAALTPDGGSWWSLPGTLTQSLTYLGVAWWWARRHGVQAVTTPPVLERPGSPR